MKRCFHLKHAIEDLIEMKVIFAPPANQPNVTKNSLPNHHVILPPRNVNLLVIGREIFDPSVLITPVGHLLPVYHILENNHICIIRGIEEMWLE